MKQEVAVCFKSKLGSRTLSTGLLVLVLSSPAFLIVRCVIPSLLVSAVPFANEDFTIESKLALARDNVARPKFLVLCSSLGFGQKVP